jgi:alkanesulfonate monooxygenase SsuD/methylene tetrahydromethanopterin reductase-like flavin-dependent oxidoreductase (luciferase family)
VLAQARTRAGPAVWLGSLSMKALDRVIEYCDGWYPVGAEYEALARRVRGLREAADRAGRQTPAPIFILVVEIAAAVIATQRS